jgi:hypothetical protein
MDSFHSISFLLILLCIYRQFQFIYTIKCNFEEFKKGCADETGSECDTKANKCICKPDFTIRLREFCLQPKYIGAKCFSSAQCNHIANAGCFNYREEYNQNPSAFFGFNQKNWPSGNCRCKIGHHYDNDSNTCVKKVIGSWCSNLWDCKQEDKRLNNAICENNVCKCSPYHYYNQSTHDCHYRETYGNACIKKDDCIHPAVCNNNTCICVRNYHFDVEKTPKCQPNNNLNDSKSEESQVFAKGDKSFEIFILTAIPVIIIFLTLKPCLKKFGKCKPQSDEVICGSKEISIKCSNFNKDFPLNQHQFCREKLQTIEEVVEEIKAKEEEILVGDDDREQTTQKSIEDEMPEENKLEDSRVSVECAQL